MGPDNRRILIATVASVAILVLWQLVFKPPEAPHAKPVAASATKPVAEAPLAAPAVQVVPVPEAPEERITLRGEAFAVTLSSHGGAVAKVELLGSKFRHDEGGQAVPIDLIHVDKGQPYPLSVGASAELGGATDATLDPSTRAAMRVVSQDATSVVFEGRVGAASIRKAFRLTGRPFELALDLEVSGAPGAGTISVLYPGFMPPSTSSGGFFSGPALEFARPVCRAGEKTERFKVDGDELSQKLAGVAGWAGIDQHYFIGALIPSDPMGTCVFQKGAVLGSSSVALQLPVDPAGKKLSFKLYAGPKALDTLKGYGRGFETAIDYGPVTNFFAFFAQGLLLVMRWLQGLARNWGLAIILLTLAVKVLLYPLTHKSMKSMAEMRKLAPEVEKLKAKFGSDKEKLNVATMQLYQQHKVNPLGGCLPMLLQMPIWFALYAALQTSVELYREPFLWMSDLTAKDPYFILPIAMGVTSFIMQKLSPQPADNSQAKMMLYFFPGFFTVMMLFVPSGLTLYIFVNNLLSIVQQQLINRAQARAT